MCIHSSSFLTHSISKVSVELKNNIFNIKDKYNNNIITIIVHLH